MTPHISENFSKELMIGIGFAFLVIPTFFIVLRLVAKSLGRKGITTDDYLAICTLAFGIGCCIAQLVGAIDGQLGQHQKTYPNGSPILDDPGFVVYEKVKTAVNILGILGQGFGKLTILVLYRQIFTTPRFKVAVRVVIVLVSLWTIVYFFTHLISCYPITAFVEAFYNNHCLQVDSMWRSAVITDFLLDVIVLVLPMPLIATLKLQPIQKLGVVGMFLLGSGICAISLVRALVFFQIINEYHEHYNDDTYYGSSIVFWTTIEVVLAVICSTLPTLRPLWLIFASKPGQSSAIWQGNHRARGSSGNIYGDEESKARPSRFTFLVGRENGRHDRLNSLPELDEGLELEEAGIQTSIGRTAKVAQTQVKGESGVITVESTIEQKTILRK